MQRRIGDDEVIKQLPASLQTLLTLERFHLHDAHVFQDRSRDPEFDAGYFPQNCGAFKLPCFWVRRKHLFVYGRQEAGCELSFFEGDRADDRVLFPVHPTSLRNYREFLAVVQAQDASAEGLTLWAAPTSSTRTLLAWPDDDPAKALFVKTSLHSPIFGDRKLRPIDVARSVGLTQLMQHSSAALPRELNYCPESVGVAPRFAVEGGVLLRSIPEGLKANRCVAAPLFSLFGGQDDRKPLLLEILERRDLQLRQFLDESLCAPFATMWLHLSLRLGLILEAHGQDLLFALSPTLAPLHQFIYRDFEGLQADWELRRASRLAVPIDMPHAWRWREAYGAWQYPLGELTWYKWDASLFGFVDLVLKELERAVQRWNARGFLFGPELLEDELTMMFSRRLWRALDDMFGVRPSAEYDVHRHRIRFLKFLLELRRALMERCGAVHGAMPDGAHATLRRARESNTQAL